MALFLTKVTKAFVSTVIGGGRRFAGSATYFTQNFSSFGGCELHHLSLSTSLIFSGTKIRNSLFTDASLGLCDYDLFVKAKKEKLQYSKEEFWRRMDSYFEKHTSLFVYTDDLKMAIALADCDEDFQRVIKLCLRYEEQSVKMKLFVYNFGPLVMRMFYRCWKPNLAYDMIRNEAFKGFFRTMDSYMICMDLLFESQRYEQVQDVWETYTKADIAATYSFPRSLQVLYTAACYKLNSKDSCQAGLQYISDCVAANVLVVRKAIYFMVALCLQQNKPQMALELLDFQTISDDFTTSYTLRCLALVRLGRFTEAVELVEQLLATHDLPSSSKNMHKISFEVIEELRTALHRENVDQTLREKLQRLTSFLKLGIHMVGVSVDQLVCFPVLQIKPRKGPAHAYDDEISTPPLSDVSRLVIQDSTMDKVRSRKGEVRPSERYGTDPTGLLLDEVQALRKKWTTEKVTHAVADRIRREGPFET
ncbi:unnamed protein product [Soboliphyme baturini]|uniref:Pentatricopeptide repeat-containing protein 2, mitochondrial n=1 Tax=Soboliphyme baturini TaxID=241478 RepID=A0A183IBG9_9BILA|nr:unnamed protein product [Soboliphyme baturini]